MVMKHTSVGSPQRTMSPREGALLRVVERQRARTDEAIEKLPSLSDLVVSNTQRDLSAMRRLIAEAQQRIQEEGEALNAIPKRGRGAPLHELIKHRRETLRDECQRVTDLGERADTLKVSLTTIPANIPPLKLAPLKELLGEFRRLRDAYWERLYLIPIVQKLSIEAIQSVVVDGKTVASRLHVGSANGGDDAELRRALVDTHREISAVVARIDHWPPGAKDRQALAKLLLRAPLDPDDLNDLFKSCLEKRERLADLEIGLISRHRSFRAAERAEDPRFPEWQELVTELGGTALRARGALEQIKSLYQPYQRVKQYIAAANHRFVCSTVLRGNPLKPWKDDLMQEGMIGMMRAIEKFNVDTGLSLLTYASYWVFQKASREQERLGSSVVIPAYQYKVLRQMRQDGASNDRRSHEDLARSIGADPSDVRSLRPLVSGVGSLDHERPNSEGSFVRDLVVDQRTPQVELEIDRDIRRELLKEAVSRLSPRERRVLTARFGLTGDPPLTLEEVGRLVGVTRERIRQVERDALLHLRYGEHGEVLRNIFEELLD